MMHVTNLSKLRIAQVASWGAFRWLPICLACLYSFSAIAQGQSKPLLETLTTEGVVIVGDTKFSLPSPTLQLGMAPAQRTSALEKLSGNNGWARFSRDSVVAPVTIELDYIKDAAGERAGHHVHSAYAVHTDLDTLLDQDLMQQLFGVGPGSDASSGMTFTQLTDQELREAGVTSPSQNVTFGRMTLMLLGKIQIRGTLRLEKTETPAGINLAWILDPQFEKAGTLQATWTKIEPNEVGDKQATEAQRYSGMAGYLDVSRVVTKPDDGTEAKSASSEVLVLESHLLMHEPQEWFSGSNFVRSKLPLGIQESARNFRRKLDRRN